MRCSACGYFSDQRVKGGVIYCGHCGAEVVEPKIEMAAPVVAPIAASVEPKPIAAIPKSGIDAGRMLIENAKLRAAAFEASRSHHSGHADTAINSTNGQGNSLIESAKRRKMGQRGPLV